MVRTKEELWKRFFFVCVRKGRVIACFGCIGFIDGDGDDEIILAICHVRIVSEGIVS